MAMAGRGARKAGDHLPVARRSRRPAPRARPRERGDGWMDDGMSKWAPHRQGNIQSPVIQATLLHQQPIQAYSPMFTLPPESRKNAHPRHKVGNTDLQKHANPRPCPGGGLAPPAGPQVQPSRGTGDVNAVMPFLATSTPIRTGVLFSRRGPGIGSPAVTWVNRRGSWRGGSMLQPYLTLRLEKVQGRRRWSLLWARCAVSISRRFAGTVRATSRAQLRPAPDEAPILRKEVIVAWPPDHGLFDYRYVPATHGHESAASRQRNHFPTGRHTGKLVAVPRLDHVVKAMLRRDNHRFMCPMHPRGIKFKVKFKFAHPMTLELRV
ncbi:hypothetical protein QBC33DRAFT_519559 [Phialemonium atrogriseum]|uniref:Uncharacterized protein n=1 Tax=Phialemonium atrogriseum TaxID=1093897 RepID=A0AAJ0BSY9_9PEZI|nr:uncharacterized protein QBC33DRAFT_519559 [Phialemonium atrogriseum]KAK1762472.1 hypothetical protein QBC33DRAFT_519559 [Phialemonium atrogriseum]